MANFNHIPWTHALFFKWFFKFFRMVNSRHFDVNTSKFVFFFLFFFWLLSSLVVMINYFEAICKTSKLFFYNIKQSRCVTPTCMWFAQNKHIRDLHIKHWVNNRGLVSLVIEATELIRLRGQKQVPLPVVNRAMDWGSWRPSSRPSSSIFSCTKRQPI